MIHEKVAYQLIMKGIEKSSAVFQVRGMNSEQNEFKFLVASIKEDIIIQDILNE